MHPAFDIKEAFAGGRTVDGFLATAAPCVMLVSSLVPVAARCINDEGRNGFSSGTRGSSSNANDGNKGFVDGGAFNPNQGFGEWLQSCLSRRDRGGMVGKLEVIDFKVCEEFRKRIGLCSEVQSRSRASTQGGTLSSTSDNGSNHRGGEKESGPGSESSTSTFSGVDHGPQVAIFPADASDQR